MCGSLHQCSQVHSYSIPTVLSKKYSVSDACSGFKYSQIGFDVEQENVRKRPNSSAALCSGNRGKKTRHNAIGQFVTRAEQPPLATAHAKEEIKQATLARNEEEESKGEEAQEEAPAAGPAKNSSPIHNAHLIQTLQAL